MDFLKVLFVPWKPCIKVRRRLSFSIKKSQQSESNSDGKLVHGTQKIPCRITSKHNINTCTMSSIIYSFILKMPTARAPTIWRLLLPEQGSSKLHPPLIRCHFESQRNSIFPPRLDAEAQPSGEWGGEKKRYTFGFICWLVSLRFCSHKHSEQCYVIMRMRF